MSKRLSRRDGNDYSRGGAAACAGGRSASGMAARAVRIAGMMRRCLVFAPSVQNRRRDAARPKPRAYGCAVFPPTGALE